MRKLAVVLFALGSLCLMAIPAFAEQGEFAFGVNGGLAMPMGKLAESFSVDEVNGGIDMKLGYDFGVTFDYYVLKDLAIGADFSYAMNSMNDQEIEGTAYEDLIKVKTMQYGVHGKYFFPTGTALTPYVNLGLSMYNRKAEFSDEFMEGMDMDEDNVSDNAFGINGGVGVDYKVTPQIAVGVSGAYHYTLGEFKPEIGGEEVTALDDWLYMTFNAGLTFYFPMGK